MNKPDAITPATAAGADINRVHRQKMWAIGLTSISAVAAIVSAVALGVLICLVVSGFIGLSYLAFSITGGCLVISLFCAVSFVLWAVKAHRQENRLKRNTVSEPVFNQPSLAEPKIKRRASCPDSFQELANKLEPRRRQSYSEGCHTAKKSCEQLRLPSTFAEPSAVSSENPPVAITVEVQRIEERPEENHLLPVDDTHAPLLEVGQPEDMALPESPNTLTPSSFPLPPPDHQPTDFIGVSPVAADNLQNHQGESTAGPQEEPVGHDISNTQGQKPDFASEKSLTAAELSEQGLREIFSKRAEQTKAFNERLGKKFNERGEYIYDGNTTLFGELEGDDGDGLRQESEETEEVTSDCQVQPFPSPEQSIPITPSEVFCLSGRLWCEKREKPLKASLHRYLENIGPATHSVKAMTPPSVEALVSELTEDNQPGTSPTSVADHSPGTSDTSDGVGAPEAPQQPVGLPAGDLIEISPEEPESPLGVDPPRSIQKEANLQVLKSILEDHMLNLQVHANIETLHASLSKYIFELNENCMSLIVLLVNDSKNEGSPTHEQSLEYLIILLKNINFILVDACVAQNPQQENVLSAQLFLAKIIETAPLIHRFLITFLDSYYEVTGAEIPEDQKDYADIVRRSVPQLVTFLLNKLRVQHQFIEGDLPASALELFIQSDCSDVGKIFMENQEFAITIMGLIPHLIPWVAYGEGNPTMIAQQANILFDKMMEQELKAIQHGSPSELLGNIEEKIKRRHGFTKSKPSADCPIQYSEEALQAIREEVEKIQIRTSSLEPPGGTASAKGRPPADLQKSIRESSIQEERTEFVRTFTEEIKFLPSFKFGLRGLLKATAISLAARGLSAINLVKRPPEDFLQKIIELIPGVVLITDASGNLLIKENSRGPGDHKPLQINEVRDALQTFGHLENVLRNPLFYSLYGPLLDRDNYKAFRDIMKHAVSSVSKGLAREALAAPIDQPPGLPKLTNHFSDCVQELLRAATETIARETTTTLAKRRPAKAFAVKDSSLFFPGPSSQTHSPSSSSSSSTPTFFCSR